MNEGGGLYQAISRRIKTEEQAKVHAAIWGTEFIQFLAGKKLNQFCPRKQQRKHDSGKT